MSFAEASFEHALIASCHVSDGKHKHLPSGCQWKSDHRPLSLFVAAVGRHAQCAARRECMCGVMEGSPEYEGEVCLAAEVED
eukprot:6203276-Pleurochrysis_carterae.AAC.1